MRIRIQTFNLVVFIMMGLLALSLWSVSLYWLNQQQNEETVATQRENARQQLNQLQLQQRDWLQNRWQEVRYGIADATDKDRRHAFLNQFIQRYPQLRSLRLTNSRIGLTQSGSDFNACRQAMLAAVAQATQPAIFDCPLQQQYLIGIAGRLNQAAPLPDLVMLMPYFSFIDDFQKQSGREIVQVSQAGEIISFREIRLQQGEARFIHFGYTSNDQLRGKLSLLIPVQNFNQLWLSQVIWVVPGLLLLMFMFYRLFYRAYVGPLISLSSKMHKVMRMYLPGQSVEKRHLAPGLSLLNTYFLNLTHQAKHDMLTGLNNRSMFEERLQQALDDDSQLKRKYALVFIDIDQFHGVNQRLGQFIGDGLLKQLAKRLSDGIRESDCVSRLEEDNFAMLLEFREDDELSSLVEKIYQALIQPYHVYGREIKIAIRMGVATYPEHGQDANELALRADHALLKAQKGEWPVVFEQDEGDNSDFSAFTVIQSIRKALVNDEFKLVYQPVIHLKQHQKRYLEALLRWKDEDEHRHSIDRTIELAEKNDLIKPLTQWIIESACAELQHLAMDDMQIAINLSMIDLHDDKLPDRIAYSMTRYSVKPNQLMVEITEGQIMQDPQRVIEILKRLSDMGISLTIDDFGTGQASLTYLKNLPVEKLKIDRSFVKDMVHDIDDSAIVEATIKLAHTLGKEVVAEGVENSEIHELLVQMDCDYVQGYYISYPLEWDQIHAWFEHSEAKTAS
ncbi:MAG: bifunctional diguanylate cyclase/phosphodiesterase [Gammaproteobacteria bacterium]|nr:bifunctional diguanylate cyclase/phosphodiesterase [Gammaproteobacteria bacterium]